MTRFMRTPMRTVSLRCPLFLGSLLLLGSPALAAPGAPCDDQDADLVCDTYDNCPEVANADQSDVDGDGQGDLCDPCVADPLDDADGDGVCGNLDRCPDTLPDAEPRMALRYYLGADGTHFERTAASGVGGPPQGARGGDERAWTTVDTGGCSCAQLQTRLEGASAAVFGGCSDAQMEMWVGIVGSTACQPNCEGRECGFDGCSGLCGGCTADEACVGGVCQVPDPCGRVTDCDDANACTVDVCEPGVGCVHTPSAVGASCDDGNACTAGDRCVNGVCLGDAVDLCAVDTGCSVWSCDPLGGPYEEILPDGASCEIAPGDVCVAGVCEGGECVETPALECDDADACTADGCDPATGCVHAPISCDDGDDCTDDLCDPATGCLHEPSPLCGGGSCCEANPTPSCDQPEIADCVCGVMPECCDAEWNPLCAGVATLLCGARCDGGCTPGVEICDGLDNDCDRLIDEDNVCGCDPAACDDGDPCTVDGCDPLGRCIHDPEPGCEPDGCCVAQPLPGCGDPEIEACVCNLDPSCCTDWWHPVCADLAAGECGAACGGTCIPSPEICDGLDNDCDGVVDGPRVCDCDPAACDDGDPCTFDGCDPFGGCAHDPDPACVCPDGCDDGVVCTMDWCDPYSGGCRHEPDPGCEPGSDCCVAHEWGWCASPQISECVCAQLPECCDGQWDQHCVEAAAACGLDCTCEPSPEVCDGLDNDCDGVVDSPGVCECPAGACDDGDPCTIDRCDPATGACTNDLDPACGGGSDCCVEHPTPGCEDPNVTACVCDLFPECCDLAWMPHCADMAQTECAADCGGGCVPSPEVCDGLDNDCDGVIDGPGVCECPATGCDDGDPCTIDLCDAAGQCAHEVDPACGGGSECCVEHPTPGCEDPNVTACVCDLFPECCDLAWMPHCADMAQTECAADCGGGCVPSPEVCDGLDNDCDGVVDGPDVCGCVPSPEVCDGLDNDCDGVVDGPGVCSTECGPDGAACDDGDPCTDGDTCLGGVCVGPFAPCDDGDPCTVDSCTAAFGIPLCSNDPDPACGCVPSPEVCDGLDNDCDGVVDGPDVCGCVPTPEVCDGLDNDCDGVIDGPGVCECPAGACDDGDPCTIDRCDPATGACSNDLDPTCGGGTSDCCIDHTTPGCSEPDVTACVCDLAPECCDLEWMPHCADMAQLECAASCGG